MPTFVFKSPEGKEYEVSGPEGATEAQAFQILQKQLGQEIPGRKQDISLTQAVFGDKSMGDYLQGRVEAAKEVATPEYWKGLYSEATKPLPAVDLMSLRNPQSGGMDDAKNAALGVVMSVGPTSPMSALQRAGIRGQPAGQAVRDVTLSEAGQLGMVVPRSYVKPGVLSNLGERVGGKQAIESVAGAKNVEVINDIARRSLGLDKGTQITPEVLSGMRKEAGKAYEAVKSIGKMSPDDIYKGALDKIANKYSGTTSEFPELARNSVNDFISALNKESISANGAVEMVKKLRFEGGKALKSLDPEQAVMGMVRLDAAKAIDDLIARTARKSLDPKTFDEYLKARTLIAKTHTIERALNESTGNVSARQLAKALKRGEPLTGELKTVARFAGAVKPSVVGEQFGTGPAGGMFEPLSYGVAGGLSGAPGGIAAGGIPIIGKTIARPLMLTRPSIRGYKSGMLDSYITQRLIAGTGGSNQ